MNIKDFFLLIAIVLICIGSQYYANLGWFNPAPPPDVPFASSDDVLAAEGMIAIDINVHEDGSINEDEECPCRGTKRVDSPDGITKIQCPCGPGCNCKRAGSPFSEEGDEEFAPIPRFQRQKRHAPIEDGVLPAPRDSVYKESKAEVSDYQLCEVGGGIGFSVGPRDPNQRLNLDFGFGMGLGQPQSRQMQSRGQQPQQNPLAVGRKMLLFTAEWCGPCQRFEQDYGNELREKGWGLTEDPRGFIVKLDFDKNARLRQYYKVNAAPTFILIENGRLVARMEGYHTGKEVSEFWYKNFPRESNVR